LVNREVPGFEFSGRSDIYVYFWPHLNSFLKPDGRMGLLTSSSWLDVEYGFRLQKWFLETFKILAILESTVEPWFEGARVQTAVTIVEPCATENERMDNTVKFVQLRVPVAELLKNDGTEDGRQRASERLRDLIISTNHDISNVQMRILVRSQKELWDEGCRIRNAFMEEDADTSGEKEEENDEESMHEWGKSSSYVGGKWGRYLRAPDLFFEILAKYGQNFVPLSEIAEVRFGIKTGCDAFFLPEDSTTEALQSEENSTEFKARYGISRSVVESGSVKIIRAGDGTVWPIETQYLEPELHNLMDINTLVIQPEALSRVVFLVNEPKVALKGTLALQYIKYGEKETFGKDKVVPERSTCKSRPIWYDVSGGKRGDAFWPMTQKFRHVVPSNPEYGSEKNKRKLMCNHNVFDIASNDRTLSKVLVAMLNSTVVAFFKQFYGRRAGMEGTLKTEVVDVKMLLVPDIRRASPSIQIALLTPFEQMTAREIDYFLEEAFLPMIPLEKLEGMISKPPTLPSELRHSDRQELDRTILSLIGVPEREIADLLERLYRETTLIYRRGRILDIRTSENKRKANKSGSASAKEIADSVVEGLPSGTIRVYPKDFLNDLNDVDHYSLPEGAAKLVEDMFHNPRLTFKSDQIEFRHREQAKLALTLHNSGIDSTIPLPIDSSHCDRIQKEWTSYWANLNELLKHEVEQRTPDEQKTEAALRILLRRVVSH
jgi:hypothetical protein